jgi:hypothetical protein
VNARIISTVFALLLAVVRVSAQTAYMDAKLIQADMKTIAGNKAAQVEVLAIFEKYLEYKESPTPKLVQPPAFDLAQASPKATTITIAWPTNSQASSYQLFRSNTDPSDPKKPITTWTVVYDGPYNAFTDFNLDDNSSYFYKVRTINDNGYFDSVAFAAKTAKQNVNTLPASRPLVPQALTVEIAQTPGKGASLGPKDSRTLSIGWQPGGPVEVGSYQLYRVESPSWHSMKLVYSGLQTSFVDTGLSAGTTYFYAVRATNDRGYSNTSQIAFKATTPHKANEVAAELTSEKDLNPFLLEFKFPSFDDAKNTEIYKPSFPVGTGGSPQAATSSAAPGSQDSTANKSAGSGLSINTAIDATSQFITDRAEQELTVYLIDSMKANLEKYPEFKVFFPNIDFFLQGGIFPDSLPAQLKGLGAAAKKDALQLPGAILKLKDLPVKTKTLIKANSSAYMKAHGKSSDDEYVKQAEAYSLRLAQYQDSWFKEQNDILSMLIEFTSTMLDRMSFPQILADMSSAAAEREGSGIKRPVLEYIRAMDVLSKSLEDSPSTATQTWVDGSTLSGFLDDQKLQNASLYFVLVLWAFRNAGIQLGSDPFYTVIQDYAKQQQLRQLQNAWIDAQKLFNNIDRIRTTPDATASLDIGSQYLNAIADAFSPQTGVVWTLVALAGQDTNKGLLDLRRKFL